MFLLTCVISEYLIACAMLDNVLPEIALNAMYPFLKVYINSSEAFACRKHRMNYLLIVYILDTQTRRLR